MAVLPLSDRFGNLLVSFDPAAGAEPERPDDAVPMPLSLVVAMYAAVYRLVLRAMPQLVADAEVLDFRWWDPRSPLPGDMSPLDAEIGRRVSHYAHENDAGHRP